MMKMDEKQIKMRKAGKSTSAASRFQNRKFELSSGRANSESPTLGPRGDLSGRRLDATGVGYINMCQPKLSCGKDHFHGGTKKENNRALS